MKVRVTKITDDKFKGKHPNGINEGYITEGDEISQPRVGEPYSIFNVNGYDALEFKTSTVTQVSKTMFKTLNSTYKREVIG